MERMRSSSAPVITKPDSESLTLVQEDTELNDVVVDASELQFFNKIFTILLHWLVLIVREVCIVFFFELL